MTSTGERESKNKSFLRDVIYECSLRYNFGHNDDLIVDTSDLQYFLFLKDAQYQQITNELAEKSKKVEKEGAVMEM